MAAVTHMAWRRAKSTMRATLAPITRDLCSPPNVDGVEHYPGNTSFGEAPRGKKREQPASLPVPLKGKLCCADE
jgi:hypothetical protein